MAEGGRRASTSAEKRRNNERSSVNSDSDKEDEEVSFLSEEANKVVKSKYQQLMGVVHQHSEEKKNMDMCKLQMLVLDANEAFQSVKRPREAAIDAQLLKVCGSMAKHNIEDTQSNIVVFKPRDFAQKLRSYIEEDEEEPEEPDEELTLVMRIAKKFVGVCRTVSGMEPLYSAIQWEKPQRIEWDKLENRASQRRKADEVAEMKKVSALTHHEEEEESEAVSWLCKILRKAYAAAGNNPLPFFNFVIDPLSFSHTVENLFNVSLLVREQYAEIIEDQDGLPLIQPTQTAATGSEAKTKQAILSLQLKDWKFLCKAFKIKRAMIPRNGSLSKRKM